MDAVIENELALRRKAYRSIRALAVGLGVEPDKHVFGVQLHYHEGGRVTFSYEVSAELRKKAWPWAKNPHRTFIEAQPPEIYTEPLDLD